MQAAPPLTRPLAARHHPGVLPRVARPFRARRAARMRVRAGPSDVFVLDFDGVLVDSEPEVSASAFKAASARWPQLFEPLDEAARAQIMQGLRATRPALVRGYESMVMARMLLEDPGCVEAILSGWHPLLEQTLDKWGEDWQELQEGFEAQRAYWLANDRAGWLALNKPYPGMVDAVAQSEYPIYFASSKAPHRVSTLLQHHFGLADVTPESPRLFASLIPPESRKAEALMSIGERPVCSDSGTKRHFIDDRLETLLAVQERPELAGAWQLYLATWGYCTDVERAAAKAAGIRLLSRPACIELLKWGILMGVDDGCEPTADEVAAGVAPQLPRQA